MQFNNYERGMYLSWKVRIYNFYTLENSSQCLYRSCEREYKNDLGFEAPELAYHVTKNYQKFKEYF